jgi:prepilin peptidase CpaA
MTAMWLLLVPFALVIAASVYDLTQRDIPDWIAIVLLTWAVATATVGQHPEGWRSLFAGLGLALVVSLVLYAAKCVSGGDVKLLTALGAVLGLRLLVTLLVGTAIAGSVLGIVALARKQRTIAYAPAMAIGFLIVLIVHGLSTYRSIG